MIALKTVHFQQDGPMPYTAPASLELFFSKFAADRIINRPLITLSPDSTI